MWKILGGLCCIGLVLLVIGGVLAMYLSNWRFRRLSRQTVPTVCISCQGKGWIKEQERTLRFDGDGFVDGTVDNRLCSACGGTGVIHR
jgi:hypothetical protein